MPRLKQSVFKNAQMNVGRPQRTAKKQFCGNALKSRQARCTSTKSECESVWCLAAPPPYVPPDCAKVLCNCIECTMWASKVEGVWEKKCPGWYKGKTFVFAPLLPSSVDECGRPKSNPSYTKANVKCANAALAQSKGMNCLNCPTLAGHETLALENQKSCGEFRNTQAAALAAATKLAAPAATAAIIPTAAEPEIPTIPPSVWAFPTDATGTPVYCGYFHPIVIKILGQAGALTACKKLVADKDLDQLMKEAGIA